MLVRLFFVIFLSLSPYASGWATPRVLVSIKPIHSLVAGVMEGVAEPELLVVDNNVSPHTYALKPSDVIKMEKAKIIFWVGEAYESFLKNYLTQHPSHKVVIDLSQSPNLVLLPYRQGGLWGLESSCEEHHGHSHGDRSIDGHIWLSPKNAEALVDHIAQVLVEQDPGHKTQYLANRDAVIAKLKELAHELHQELVVVKAVPYMLLHDFMNYFDHFFGTNAVGVIRIQPEIEPSVQHMVQVQKRLSGGKKVHALFAEPQFSSKRLEAIAQSAKIRFGFLDYLGSNLKPGPNCYFETMRQLAAQLKRVLS